MINLIDVGAGGRGKFERPWNPGNVNQRLLIDPFLRHPEDAAISDHFAFQDLLLYQNEREIYYKCCIAETESIKRLCVCRKKNCSSLLFPDRNYINYAHRNPKNYDVSRFQDFPCLRLDTIIERHGLKMDFLKTDTQGLDLEVIQSCGKYLTTDIIGLQVELWSVPFYKNIVLFHEADRWLKSQNFELIRFMRGMEKSRFFNDYLYIRYDFQKMDKINEIRWVYGCDLSLF
tara:strand:- start:1420 stop:2112 length:693 start_codon:yes stop_codon:yes gene_type:complete